MKKIVNINSPIVLYIFTPPMSGVFNKVELSTGDIKYCLMQGVKVEEILEDGSTIQLDFNNYNKDNNIKLPKKVIKEQVKVEDRYKKNEEIKEDETVLEVEDDSDNIELVEDSVNINNEEKVIENNKYNRKKYNTKAPKNKY